MGVHDGNYRAAKKALGIPADEPIFVIRGQDKSALGMLARYRNRVEELGAGTPFLEGIEVVAEQFAQWQTDNADKVKVPD
jgi:hypothetical protein